MPDPRCRVAIVGAGYTAREHLRAFADLPGCVVSAIHSRTRSRAEALAREFSVPAVCDSVAELHAKSGAQLVVMTVPELEANRVARACFAHPWTVLMEKPPGYRLDDALDIEAAAKAARRDVRVALNRRFMSTVKVATGELSRAAGARFIKIQDQENAIRARAAGQPEKVVQNWMFANSIHMIDLFRVFGRGPVTRVEPVERWNPDKPGIVLGKVFFDSGDWGLYEAIWNGPGPWAASVTTSSFRCELRPLEKIQTQVLGEPAQTFEPAEIDVKFKPGFRVQAEAAVKAALGEPSDSVTLADAIETMRLIDALYAR